MDQMEHSRYYVNQALEKSAGLAGFALHYGLDLMSGIDKNPLRREIYGLLDTISLFKHGRVKAGLENLKPIMKPYKAKHASAMTKKPLKGLALGTLGAVGVGLGIRAIMPSRFARVYVNDANAKMKAYVKQEEKKNEHGIK